MPQMAPIGGLSLFVLFSIMFILFSMMNYYSMIPKSPKYKNYKKRLIKSLNSKWYQTYFQYSIHPQVFSICH